MDCTIFWGLITSIGAGTGADCNLARILGGHLPAVFPILKRVLLYLGAMP